MPYYKVTEENGTKKLKDYSKPSVVMPSYIGMLDISTTNSTLAKVQAIYGADTTWIQHSGYVLRGATSGVTANSATKTGGNDNAVVVQHSHSVSVSGGNHRHSSTDDTLARAMSTTTTDASPLTAQGTHGYWRNASLSQTNTSYSGNLSMSGTASNNTSWSDGTNANIPNYKSVYIWERTA